MAAGYPELVVYLRLILAAGGSEEAEIDRLVEAAWDRFDVAVAFYGTFGVVLKALGAVEVRTDLDGYPELETAWWPIAASEWLPGQYWINVFFAPQVNDHTRFMSAVKGRAIIPSVEDRLAVLVTTGSPEIVFSHELGHALGLPHIFREGESDPLGIYGERYIDLAMAPFADETEAIKEADAGGAIHGNLMNPTAQTDWTTVTILPSQINRLRLTIVTSQSGVAMADDVGLAPVASYLPFPATAAALLRSFL